MGEFVPNELFLGQLRELQRRFDDMSPDLKQALGFVVPRTALDAADARDVGVKALTWIDQQVMTAAADLDAKGKENPAWAFIDYEANAMSFGRWAKCGPNPAPYIRADIALSALHPASPLGAVAMREKAAKAAAEHQVYQSEICANRIRALPTTFTDAELFAAAAEMPEVRAMTKAANTALGYLTGNMDGDYDGDADPADMLRAALAPFARKGGQ